MNVNKHPSRSYGHPQKYATKKAKRYGPGKKKQFCCKMFGFPRNQNWQSLATAFKQFRTTLEKGQ